LPRRPRPSLFHPVNRLGGGPPCRQSLSLSLRIHVCFPERPIHGAHIERRRQPAAMTCVGVHGHSKPHAEKSYKEGSTERRRDGGRHPKLPVLLLPCVPLQSCMHMTHRPCTVMWDVGAHSENKAQLRKHKPGVLLLHPHRGLTCLSIPAWSHSLARMHPATCVYVASVPVSV
jgi:hypothetical protein